MTSTATHALRDRWFVSFLPLLTADMVTVEFNNDWKVAAQRKMQRLDWVTTVEEVWSTMNSLPRIQQLGVGTTFIFSREDKEPSFETFPNGSRLVVKLFKSPTTEKGLETIIAAVLGEMVTEEATNGVPVCDVIRIAARPSRDYSDTVRVEVWLNDASYSGSVADYLKSVFRERNVPSGQYSIEENPFEAGSPASPKLMKTPAGTSSPLTSAAKEERGLSAEAEDREANSWKPGTPAKGGEGGGDSEHALAADEPEAAFHAQGEAHKDIKAQEDTTEGVEMEAKGRTEEASLPTEGAEAAEATGGAA